MKKQGNTSSTDFTKVCGLEADHTGECGIYCEHNVCFESNTYLLIYGYHTCGHFICIPNWRISCEANAVTHSSAYNAERMRAAGLDENAAEALAIYIESWAEHHCDWQAKQSWWKKEQAKYMEELNEIFERC